MVIDGYDLALNSLAGGISHLAEKVTVESPLQVHRVLGEDEVFILGVERQWMKRETDFLRARNESAIITGGVYILLTIINVIISYVLALNEMVVIQYIVNFGISFVLLFFVIKKHNRVNEIYNLEHFPENMKEPVK